MKKDCSEWKEIHGFRTPGEYKEFSKFLNAMVKEERIEEVPVDPDYGHGEIFGGRWFLCNKSGDLWRLVEPDFPFRGLWERIRKEKISQDYLIDTN